MSSADIGLIGLAVMGSNLALNIAENGYTIAVHNRTASKIDDFMVVAKQQGLDKKIVPEADIKAFIASVKRPRSIIIMVKAGQPVDDMIEQLLPMLEKGDAILECGNSLYTDTQRRFDYLAPKGIGYLGIGVSGERVAAFEDRVAGLQHRQQLLDHVVDRLARLDHDDDRTRPLHRLDERLDIRLRHTLGREPLLLGRGHEVVDLARRAVVDRDGVALFGDVQCKVRTHHGKADQADISGGHKCSSKWGIGVLWRAFWHAKAAFESANSAINQRPARSPAVAKNPGRSSLCRP